MKKLLINLTLVSLLFFIILLTTLSTIGIKTNKFNEFIKEKTSEKGKINLELKSIKFKINPKKLSLFLETENPNINYSDVTIPVQNLKVYVDVLSLIKTRPKIKKINLSLEELDVVQLNKLSRFIKPSNFKSFLNNKIKKGKLITEIEIFLDEDGLFKDFIAKGTIKDLQAEFLGSLNLIKDIVQFRIKVNTIFVH